MNRLQHFLVAAACCALTAGLAGAAGAALEAPPKPHKAPVVVDGRPLFEVTGTASFPADRRADDIARRIGAIADDATIKPDQIRLEPDEQGLGTAIFAGQLRLMLVVDGDAQLEGIEGRLAAMIFAEKIRDALRVHREERTPGNLLRGALYTLLATAALVLFVWLLHLLFKRIDKALRARFDAKITQLQTRSFGMLGAEQLWAVFERALRATWWLLVIVAILAYVDFALATFPWTRQAANWILSLVLDPLQTMGNAVAAAIPNLVFIAILALVVRYLIEALRLFFVSIDSGAIRPGNFPREWAMITFKLIRLGVIAFAVVVAYPYIPGSSSEAFKGVSVFAGVLFSLGASSIVSNTLAGYSLIYRRAFKVGDRVMIGKHVGDVAEIRAQVTVLHTPKNEEIVVPNSTILNSEIVNYSALGRKGQLILHSSVTIGYDVPWRQVEAMLLDAAGRTQGLLKAPPPFVLKTALSDFYVEYQVNAYCDDASRMPALYSKLHENIVDAFNEHGVQIMSPHFVAQPAQAVLVPKDKWFEPPARDADREAGGAARR